MRRILVAILTAILSVSFTGVIFVAEPAQEYYPGQEMIKEKKQEMQDMKEMPEKKMQELKSLLILSPERETIFRKVTLFWPFCLALYLAQKLLFCLFSHVLVWLIWLSSSRKQH